MSSGIIAAQDGKTINDTPQAYRSDLGHLKIDTREEVGHLGIYDGKCGSAVLNTSNTFKEQVFFERAHKLPYIPRVSVYMLVRDAPAVLAAIIGRYAGGYIYYGAVPMSEMVFLRVDKTYVRLIHRSGTIDATSYNSILQNMRIRAKFMIFSNDVADEPYESGHPFIEL